MNLSWYGSHVYLNDFINKYSCRRIMEIGVYNGENAVSMIKTAVKKHPANVTKYYGFDFFHYYTKTQIERKIKTLGCKYTLFEGNSLNTVPEAVKSLPFMDIIFIDGGKSYNVALSDWEGSSSLMHDKTGVFVHNVDFLGVRRRIDTIPLELYTVRIFNSNSEGRVAMIKRR